MTVPDRPVELHLGGDRRGGRRAVRRPDRATIVRFDLNTSPDAAGPRRRGSSPPAGSRRRSPSTRRPTTGGWSRPPRPATASAADEILVGAGADEILDIVGQGLPAAPAAAAVVPIPTYAMYRVADRAARRARRRGPAARAPTAGWALDLRRDPRGRRDAAPTLVWLCSPNNPTALPEPDGAIAALLDGLARRRRARPGAPAPVVVLDEAYAEFVGTIARSALRDALPAPRSSSAPRARPMRSPACGSGSRSRARDHRRGSSPYRPPGSVSTVSVTVVTEALRDPEILEANLERVEARARAPDRGASGALGWRVGPSPSRTSCSSTSARRSEPERVAEGLLRRGLVPRTFPPAIRSPTTSASPSAPPTENDRLIAAAREIARPSHGRRHAR